VIKRKFILLTKRLLELPLKACLVLPVVFMRIISPVVIIRIGLLDIGRIGGMHLADPYLCLKNDGFFKPRSFDIWFFLPTKVISNQQWLKMWKRELKICPLWCSKFMLMLNNINKSIPGYEDHVINILPESLDKQNHIVKSVLNNPGHFLRFTKKEQDFGIRAVADIGIPFNIPFICIHNRDSAYLDYKYPNSDWSYHNFRDSGIKNHLMAMNKLTERGYYVIRMGEIVKDRINSNNPAINDYASNGKRTEFLDIFLISKCKFMICSEGGLHVVPMNFRKPIVMVNLVLLWAFPRWPKGIILFKKYYSYRENRFLSIKEIVGLGKFFNSNFLRQEGVELIENTDLEIRDAAIEMDKRLNAKWETTEEEKKLQNRFWEILGPSKLKNPDLHCCSNFLQQNQELLE